ncbi:MAG: RNA-binding protein [Hyphomicrobiaceae bacterium]|nr:RNA-binding protein [Hyphomicrobiaceae bacterium]
MPKGPKGEKRPADVIANAIKVARIATGEEPEEIEKTDDGKDKAAQSLGRRGGKARAEKLSAKKRSEIAKKAAAKRWEKE